jgi:hypothetical protein
MVWKAGAATFAGGATSVDVTTGADGTAVSPTLTAGTATGPFVVTASSANAQGVGYALTVLPATADVKVNISGPKRESHGSQFAEHITVTNSGPATATAISTGIKVPRALKVRGADGATRVGSRRVWALPSLAAGHSQTYTLSLAVKRHAHGHAKLVAKTRAHQQDPHRSNNRAKRTVHVG